MKVLLGVFLSIVCTFSTSIPIGNLSNYTEPYYATGFVQGGSLVGTQERTINYSSVKEDTYVNPYEAPVFIPSLSNACAVEAGGNAIVYFDRLYDELIPNYKHKYVWGKFTYGTQNEAVDDMFLQLYNLMGTIDLGTTIDGFKNGLTEYVRGKGRTLNITSATGDYCNTNMDYLKEQLRQEKLAVIFLDTFAITPFSGYQSFDGYDKLTYYLYTGYHTMLIYGYKDVYYYDTAGNIIGRETYFFASTGYNGARLALLNINNFCVVDDIYVLNIT